MMKLKNYKKQVENWPKRSDNFYNKAYSSEFSDLLKNKQLSILEIGFGPGHFLRYLKSLGFKNVYGVEIDEGLYSQVKADFIDYELFNDDIVNFFEKNQKKFDRIFLIDVLEHIDSKKIPKLLSMICKKLNKDGICVIRTINAESVWCSSLSRYFDYTHVDSFTRFSIGPLLKESGFKNLLIRGQRLPKGFFFVPLKIMRFLTDCLAKLITLPYWGKLVFKSIQTPNLIVYAKKK